MEEEVKSLGDYLDIVRRYKGLIIVTALIFIVVSAAVAYLLPATYKSEGLILIESQEIPRDLVKSTVTSYASQRIEVIKQRTMTTSNVMQVVDKFNLYSEMRKRSPPSEVVSLFRENIGVSMVEANVTDPQSGRTKRASIAFTVSFMDKSPVVAQQVANELATSFLDENVRTRTSRAAETTAFLNDEAGKFQRRIQKTEKELAEFKDKYSESLPELLQYNLSVVERLQDELVTNQNQVMQLKDQIVSLTIDQSNQHLYISPVQPTGGSLTAAGELAKAESELSHMQSRYSGNHPDVVQLKRQIETLKEDLGIDSSSPNIAVELRQAEKELSSLKKKYAANHPDVKSLSNRVNTLRQQGASSQQKPSTNVSRSTNSSNPIYLQMSSKIRTTEREVSRLINRQSDLRTKLIDYEARIVKTYQVERQYVDLSRDHENHLAKYRELRAKQLEAELAQNLESENKGESFTLIEPPQVPSKAEKPNRKKILVMGIMASIGLGFGLALLVEMITGGVRGYSAITSIVGSAPLVVVPLIKTEEDLKSRTVKQKWWIYSAIILTLIIIACFHFFVMDLEVFWYKALRNLSLI